jgi:acid phosphatase type 7
MRWLLAVLTLATSVCMTSPGDAQAQVGLTRGPYLQEATPSGITVVWQTDRPTVPTLEYRAEDGPPDAPWHIVGGSERSRSHVISVAGLEPGSRYQYRVRADGAVLYEGASFPTLPPTDADALDFVAFGDTQTNHTAHGDVVRAILREQPLPDLLVHTGDLTDHGLQGDEWDTFFRIERDLLAKVPIYPTLGNHEDNSPLYFESFHFPPNGTAHGKGRWYSFDAGPAHFVALDVVFSDIHPGSPQYQWLDNDLARTDRPWKFVYFHFPPYNASAPHGSNWRLREILEPLFVRHKVSLVFNGHGHVYERAFGAGQPPLLYIVSGGAGGRFGTPGQQLWTRYTEASHHFVRVSIRGERITTTGMRVDGTEFDRFEGQLDASRRVAPSTVLVSPIVVPGPSVAQFLGSTQGMLLIAYAALCTLVLPLGFTAVLRPRRAAVIPVPSGAIAPPSVPRVDPHADWRGLPVLVLAAGVAALLLLFMGPHTPLHLVLGHDPYSIVLTLHAVVSTLLIIVAVLAANMGCRLAIHHVPSRRALTVNAWAAAALALLSAVLGNVLFASFRLSDGPLERLIRKAPEARVLFEFKEHVGLVPLVLATIAAFIVWRYRADLRRDRYLAEAVALLLLLLPLYVLLPMGLGALITRLPGIL